MQKTHNDLGGRIPLADPNTLTGSARDLYNSILEHAVPWAESSGFLAKLPDGRVIGPFNVALQSPEIGSAFAKLRSVGESKTCLDPKIRQIVILTIGAIWECNYERYAHKAVAHKAELPE